MTVRSNDIEPIRQLNTVLVLNTLRKTDRLLSRPNVADILGLSKVTVANIIRNLNEQGYTIEAGVGLPDRRGGRKPVLVALNCDSKRAMGARVSHESIDLLISDLKGKVLKRLSSCRGENENAYELLIGMVKEVLASTNTEPSTVVGLTVAVPSRYSELDGALRADSPIPARPANESRLQAELDLPVKLVSFTRARAFAECWYNQDYADPQPFFYINLGHGLDGVAVRRNILEDKPCEFGSCFIEPQRYGYGTKPPVTVDYALGRNFFLEQTQAAYGRPFSSLELLNLANGGDERAKELFKEYGYNLGCAISLIINMLYINNIVLGGSQTRAWAHFNQSLYEGLNLHLPEKMRGKVAVRVVKNELESGLSGALALALDHWVYQTKVLYNYGRQG